MMADAGGSPLGQWSGSDATNALREAIERFNAKTAWQTTWLLRLTWAIAALTLVMAIGVGVQIYTAMSVRAESAWVLWLEHSHLETGWKIVEAVPDRATCRKRRASAERGPRPKEFHPETTFRYMCLPDTLDPRGPKGK
jgi:hypothetical protein